MNVKKTFVCRCQEAKRHELKTPEGHVIESRNFACIRGGSNAAGVQYADECALCGGPVCIKKGA